MNNIGFSSAFNPNDIRGIYKKNITNELAYRLGRAFVVHFRTREVIVGRDMRLSSPILSKFFIKGVTDQGANAIDLGLVSSDALYFSTAFLKKPGVMITASHNPSKYNGFKFSLANAAPINDGKDINSLKDLVEKNYFINPKKGKIIIKDISTEYVKHLHSFINLKKLKKMKIIVDAGNGMAGKFFPLVSKNLPIKVIPLDFKLDGRFPDHDANPAKRRNVLHLEKVMKKKGADFGVAFDGDIDRVVFVNEKTHRVDSSLICSLIIKNILEKKRKGNFVYNSVMGKIIKEVAEKYGGNAYREKVGHTFIKRTMRKIKAEFGAENSGHYYYKKNYYADSGIITFLIVAEIYSKYAGKFSDMVREFKKYRKIDEKSLKVKDNENVLINLKNHYSKLAIKVDNFDGITFYFKDWWFNVRKSNTEPLIRLNLEADNKKLMINKKREVVNFITKFK